MSAAIHLYIPNPWETSVPEVLTAAGFQVTVKQRELPDGEVRLDHDCTRGPDKCYFGQVPMPGDSSHHFILGIYRRKHSEAMRAACDALRVHGALDADGYQRRANA